MKHLDFVFFDAGGGHRSAATALKSVIEQHGYPWEVRLVNLQEVLDSLDVFRKLTGIRMEDVYNNMLKRGWTLGSEYLVPVMHGIIRMYHPAQRQLLTKFWQQNTPDLVVSVIPNFNRALYQALQAVDPRIPLVTIVTDIADYPPHFWMEKQDQYMVCGSERACEQAKSMGYAPDRIFRTSGMILRPEFYEPFNGDVGDEREKLGLKRDAPTGIVLFGGQGSSVMLDIAKRLQSVQSDLQLILICGRNEKLATRLRAMSSRIPLHIVGFTREVPYYMHVSDFLIGKPGPGSISEALAMKLPVIIQSNAWTLPQERYNAEWVAERGLGIVLESFRQIDQAVIELVRPENFRAYQERVVQINNRAVFEIPDILARIMEQQQ